MDAKLPHHLIVSHFSRDIFRYLHIWISSGGSSITTILTTDTRFSKSVDIAPDLVSMPQVKEGAEREYLWQPAFH